MEFQGSGSGKEVVWTHGVVIDVVNLVTTVELRSPELAELTTCCVFTQRLEVVNGMVQDVYLHVLCFK
jgi:hypothetical protein